jgi:hypothetical protein
MALGTEVELRKMLISVLKYTDYSQEIKCLTDIQGFRKVVERKIT